MAGRLSGTVALVTGASSGIGAATARALAAEDAAVAVVARRRERLEDLADAVHDQGGKSLVIEADVGDERQARDAVERTVAEYGRLDVLVNNAGLMLLSPVVDASAEEWDRMVRVNQLGVFHCTRTALPYLLRAAEEGPRRVADVVTVSSVAGRVARPTNAIYSATKHAVGAFSESLRQEVTGRHVRVSLIEPGRVRTELQSHNRPEVQEQLRNRFGDIEPLEADDIADTIVYVITRPRHVALNEVLVRPTEQPQ
ncbi:MAG: SDR family NAD(P)-dependent oxidoreductase [Streptosporangiales bacterium]|nr:SDR family NAD(P)-dependent oxidoreductase [Streptosporangiales bacterium]